MINQSNISLLPDQKQNTKIIVMKYFNQIPEQSLLTSH